MRVILLAGGKGSRLNVDIPKVLVPLAGKTLIEHALDTVYQAAIDPRPIVVVGHQAGRVKQHLAEHSLEFVHQKKQLGTGHAVMICEDFVDPADDILVLYGDHALIRPQTIRDLRHAFHESHGSAIAMVTYIVPDFEVFSGQFRGFGRILRDKAGNILAIKEAKDASSRELQIKEVNPAYYLFRGEWLWDNLKGLSSSNAQNEYYLTDLIEAAISQGQKVTTIAGSNLEEAIGVNTCEQLVNTLRLIKNKQ